MKKNFKAFYDYCVLVSFENILNKNGYFHVEIVILTIVAGIC